MFDWLCLFPSLPAFQQLLLAPKSVSILFIYFNNIFLWADLDQLKMKRYKTNKTCTILKRRRDSPAGDSLIKTTTMTTVHGERWVCHSSNKETENSCGWQYRFQVSTKETGQYLRHRVHSLCAHGPRFHPWYLQLKEAGGWWRHTSLPETPSVGYF